MSTIEDIIYDRFEEFCYNDNDEMVAEYLEKYKYLVSFNDHECFEIVASNGNLKLLKLFVENGADITTDSNHVLYLCSSRKYYDCLEYLMQCGSDINTIKYTCGYSDTIRYSEQKNNDLDNDSLLI